MCYISTRANTEKTFGDFLADNWEMLLKQVFSRSGGGNGLLTKPSDDAEEPTERAREEALAR
jgi:hypothetical protein